MMRDTFKAKGSPSDYLITENETLRAHVKRLDAKVADLETLASGWYTQALRKGWVNSTNDGLADDMPSRSEVKQVHEK